MKILIVESIGAMLDLVADLEHEGHQIKWYIKRRQERDVGDNLVDAEKVDKWSPHIKWADLIIFGDQNFGQPTASLKKKGRLVIGGSPVTDKLSTDPSFLFDTAKSLNIPTKITATENEKRSTTFVTIGAFFNGYQWIKPVFQGWRFKGFLNRGKGPQITSGVAGRWIGRSKLFNEILKKFEVLLRANNFTGYMEIECIIDKGRAHLVDVICSLTGPNSLLINELQREPWGNFFERLARGSTKHIKVMSRYGLGVRVFTLPAPVMGVTDLFKDIRVRFGNAEHVHMSQIKKDDDKFWTAGTSGFICMPTGHAITLKKAAARAYQTLKEVKVDHMMYRTDIGHIPYLEDLKKWGYM